jgi:hypothetical protein
MFWEIDIAYEASAIDGFFVRGRLGGLDGLGGFVEGDSMQ